MRLVVKYHDEKPQYINVAADRLEEHDGFLLAYRGTELVGVFYLGAVDMAYLSGEGKE